MRTHVAAVALALLLFARPAAAQEETTLPGTPPPSPATAQTTSAEAMARAGLTRTDDLFWLLDDWEATTLDGYAVSPSATGLPGGPLLTVGGHPFAEGPFGQPALPVLPVHLAQVRAAEATAAPRLVAGRLAPDGAVQLRLRSPGGVGARGAFSAGNEVGDPGPFRAAEQAAPNVDRIGPQYFAEAHAGGERAGAQLSLRAVRHFTTDAAIRPRVEHFFEIDDGPPLQQLVAPRVALWGRNARLGQHRFSAHYATLRAFPFFETLGYEVPARRQHARLGLAGAFPPTNERPPGNEDRRLRYRLDYTRAALSSDADRLRSAEAPSEPALAFDGAEDRLGGHVSLRRSALHLGLSADYTHARSAGASLDDPTLLTTRAYARFALDPLLGVPGRPRLTVLLSQTDGQLGGGVLASVAAPLGARQSLDVHLAYVRRPYAADGPFWYWLGEGLRAPRAPGGAVTLPASFPASRRLAADLRWQYAFPGGGHVALEGNLRHFRALSLPLADFGYDQSIAEDAGGLVPALRLRPDAAGQTVRAAAAVARAFPAGLTHRLRYSFFAYHAAGAGGEAFTQRFARTPHHRLRYAAQVAIGRRFSLEGRLTVRTPERWPAYARAAAAAGSPYRDRLPSYARLDLTATKRLWRDHLHLRLALRNLLDAPLRTHPAGPVRRLSLFVSLEARL